MSTLIFIGGGCFLVLILLARIRGLDQFIRPLFQSMYGVAGICFAHVFSWAIYFCKTVAYSHVEFARHLILPASRIDPSVPMREELHK